MIEQKQLIKIVGADNVSSDQATLEKYSRDISFVNPVKPEFVVKPRNPDDIEKLITEKDFPPGGPTNLRVEK